MLLALVQAQTGMLVLNSSVNRHFTIDKPIIGWTHCRGPST